MLQLVFILLLASGLNLQAQDPPAPLSIWEDSLAGLAARMQEGATAEERQSAARLAHEVLEAALKSPGSWSHPFERVPPFSVQSDPEGHFRLFTWQVMGDPGQFQHYGFLQIAKSPQTPVPLLSSLQTVFPSTESISGPGEWLGQIYYRILPFRNKGKNFWVLFGFSSGDGNISRKIAEIVHLDEDNQPVFGAPLFVLPAGEGRPERRQCRIILDYAAESQVTLNYDPGLELILFDHLTPYAEGRPGARLRYIPDGTYSGFRLKRGHWHFVEQLANQSLDEAPVPFPVLDGRKGKDIMGRDRK